MSLNCYNNNITLIMIFLVFLLKCKEVKKISSYISPTIEAAGGAGVSDGPEPTPTLVVPFVALAAAAVVLVVEAVDMVTTAIVAAEAAAVVVVVESTGGCFASGTIIQMGDSSYKRIEEVCVGDTVLAYDQKKKLKTKSRVSHTFHHSPEEAMDYYLVINDNLRVTPNHPMFVEGKWKHAGELKIGDKLLDSKGKTVKIGSIKKIREKIPVYNIEVDRYHTYFADNVLVHNKEPFRRKLFSGPLGRLLARW